MKRGDALGRRARDGLVGVCGVQAFDGETLFFGYFVPTSESATGGQNLTLKQKMEKMCGPAAQSDCPRLGCAARKPATRMEARDSDALPGSP